MIKFKAYAFHWALTALIAIPVILLVAVMLIVYYVKPIRDTLGEWCAERCADMLEWRSEISYEYALKLKNAKDLETK